MNEIIKPVSMVLIFDCPVNKTRASALVYEPEKEVNESGQEIRYWKVLCSSCRELHKVALS